MPLDKNIRKVLVIGSGPIVIGQAAEFDYAGTQACRALREDGIEIVLINSNPATIMTDKWMADKIYIEPLTLTTVKRVIETERPDAILSGLGGQTALTKGRLPRAQRCQAPGLISRVHRQGRRPSDVQGHDGEHRSALHSFKGRKRR